MGGDTRNFVIFIVIAMGILLLYQAFILPNNRAEPAPEPAGAAEQLDGDDAPSPDGEPTSNGISDVELSLEEALAQSERIEIRTDAVSGSLALTGARFDDLQLLRYDTELESGEPVTLLIPEGAPGGHFMASGWRGDNVRGLPGLSSQWRLTQGDVLTPTTPITLEYTTGDLTFSREISVNDDYLFTVEESVTNTGRDAVALRPYGVVRQAGLPELDPNGFILHEGPVAVTTGNMIDVKYRRISNNRDDTESAEGRGGWAGLGTKYWLAAITPDQSEQTRIQYRTLERDALVIEANYLSQPITVEPGASAMRTSYVYAGSKSQPLLSQYEREQGIVRFTQAIDWGMFWFLTRPFFYLLHLFYGWFGNYGLAIMLLTLMLKAVLYPLNNRAFASMAKMRAVAPKMTELRERHKDNAQAMQQATMELYRKEKINPLAGCLPILPQIPIFFALYKTVFISLDARHAPFFGWIQDMSAADPTTLWNLFGLIPYDPSNVPIIGTTLAIGVWPILMGITMWAQQSLNPPPPDKIQRQIFAFLPIVFTIFLAPFAAALVIYWTWNNFLTIVQQYIIMRRQGVTTELDKRILRLRAKMKGEAEPVFEDPNAPGPALADTQSGNENPALEGNAKPESADGEKTVPDDAEANAGRDGKDGDGEKAPAKPTSKRTSSNPAAKKKKGGGRKKPGGKR